jgi:hypothetical protein
MIQIKPVDRKTKRDFTAEESEELIRAWEWLTKKASDRSIRLAEAYGKLNETDSEWTILAKRVDDCIQSWAGKVRRLGGEPRAMWTIMWLEEGKKRYWSLQPETYSEKA